jgi:hypothetical protein
VNASPTWFPDSPFQIGPPVVPDEFHALVIAGAPPMPTSGDAGGVPATID